uniref:Putative secreted protein n=1 Tax=Rhipicephalus microplus TaxID=6941 RepID=A0A6G5A258_RHIMP
MLVGVLTRSLTYILCCCSFLWLSRLTLFFPGALVLTRGVGAPRRASYLRNEYAYCFSKEIFFQMCVYRFLRIFPTFSRRR